MKLYCELFECYFCGLKTSPSKVSCRSLFETHHIQERSKGGSNNPGNLVRCCSNCHSRIHLGDIVLNEWLDFGFQKALEWRFEGVDYIGSKNSQS